MNWIAIQSRRGAKELDLILERFNRKYFAHMNQEQKKIYVAFLHEEDQSLWDWIFCHPHSAPKQYKDILSKLCVSYECITDFTTI